MRHPSEAQRFGDLGAGFLVQWELSACARPGSAGAAYNALTAIHSLKSAAELREWLCSPLDHPQAAKLRGYTALEAACADLPADGPIGPAWWDFQARSEALLEAEVAELPFQPSEYISFQLESEVNCWINAVAVGRGGLAKLSGKPLLLDLPAPVRPRALPVWGHGPQEVVEVVDFAAPAGKASRIRKELGEERLTVRLMVGGERSDAMQWQVAALAEAVAVLHPDQFWAAVDRLRGAARMAPQAIPGLLAGLAIDRERVGALAAGAELRAGLLADMRMLDLCGVPPERPLFLMGTKVFTGAEGLEALRRAVESA
jgi:hypothetical protein